MHKLLAILLRPTAAALDRLRYPRKFLLISAVVLSPVLVMGWLLVEESNRQVSFTRAERAGVAYVPEVRAVVELVQQHRGMAAALLGGHAAFEKAVARKGEEIERAFDRLVATEERLGDELRTGGRVEELVRGWKDLRANLRGLDPAESFERHSALVADLLSLIEHVGTTSNLFLDPEPDSGYLVDLVLNVLPRLTESMGQGRGIAAGAAARGVLDRDAALMLAVRVDDSREGRDQLLRALDLVAGENPALADRLRQPAERLAASVDGYLQLLETIQNSSAGVAVAADEVSARATRAIDAAYALFDRVVPELDGQLAERLNGYERVRLLTIAIVLLVIVALGYLLAAFWHASNRTFTVLSAAMERAAGGDLTVRADVSARDEMGDVARGFDAMVERFARFARDIRGAVDAVGRAAADLLEVARRTEGAIQEQRARSNEIAGAMTEMRATIEEVARNATDVANHGEDVRNEAGTGQRIVAETAGTIEKLAEGVRTGAATVRRVGQDTAQVGNVLEVISDIADSVSLLALNASIEAARAGEQGRGFAVVAGEIRGLAARTRQSVDEVRAMLERLRQGTSEAENAMLASEQLTQNSVTAAQRTQEALTSITRAVESVAEMMASVSSATVEQTAAAASIEQSVIQINEVSEENAGRASEVARSSEELATLSRKLDELVGVFRVA